MMIRPVITLTRPGLANFQLKQKQKTAHSNFNSRATSILYVLLHVFLHSQQSFMCPLLKPNLNSSVMVTAVICMCHFLIIRPMSLNRTTSILDIFMDVSNRRGLHRM